MDFAAGEKELSEEVKLQLKSMSNVRTLNEDEKRNGKRRKEQLIGGFVIFTVLFGYFLVNGFIDLVKNGEVGVFILFFILYVGCLLGMLVLHALDKNNLKRYKKVFVIKGYVRTVVPFRGVTISIVYYDFESARYRIASFEGEMFDSNKYRIRPGELTDILAVEKRKGIRALCLKPDTIN